MTDSQRLIKRYVDDGSEAAFRELVRTYIDLVYSTAIRLVAGDAYLAEDLAQMVFVQLARKARGLPADVMLGGWLHRVTCNMAAKALRSERRRRSREKEVMEMNRVQDHTLGNLAQVRPLLDEAIDKLGTEDRMAIIMRFFEQRDFRSVGDALGTNEDAAQKRVTRALDKLQAFFKSRGVTMSAAALGTALAAEAVSTAPSALAASVAATATVGAVSGGTSLTLIKAITMTKLKFGIIGGIAVACLATPLFQHRVQVELRTENQSLQLQVAQLAVLAAENERLSNQLVQVNRSPALAGNELSELLRLRSEVGRLRQAERELSQLHQQDSALAIKRGLEASAAANDKSERPKFFYVTGAVLIPGRFLWTNGMTLPFAIELAHGFTDFADRSTLQIKYPDGTGETIHCQPPTLPEAGLQPDATVFVSRLGESDTAKASESADPITK
jgi:RNA polymerase sigma factor (sigma-70 family)